MPGLWCRMRPWPCPRWHLKGPNCVPLTDPICWLPRQGGTAGCCGVWGLSWVSLSQMLSPPLPSPRLQPRWQPLAFCSSWRCLQGPGPGWGRPIGHVCTAAARPGPQRPPAHTPLRVSGRSGCSCPTCGPPSTSQSSKVSVTQRWPHPGPCPHRDTTLRQGNEGAGQSSEALTEQSGSGKAPGAQVGTL